LRSKALSKGWSIRLKSVECPDGSAATVVVFQHRAELCRRRRSPCGAWLRRRAIYADFRATSRSASAEVHDRIRDVAGTWEAAVGGIKRAIEALTPRTRLVVESVLLPGKRHHLDAMPALLRDIGIDRWLINPLVQRFHETDHMGRIHFSRRGL